MCGVLHCPSFHAFSTQSLALCRIRFFFFLAEDRGSAWHPGKALSASYLAERSRAIHSAAKALQSDKLQDLQVRPSSKKNKQKKNEMTHRCWAAREMTSSESNCVSVKNESLSATDIKQTHSLIHLPLWPEHYPSAPPIPTTSLRNKLSPPSAGPCP